MAEQCRHLENLENVEICLTLLKISSAMWSGQLLVMVPCHPNWCMAWENGGGGRYIFFGIWPPLVTGYISGNSNSLV